MNLNHSNHEGLNPSTSTSTNVKSGVLESSQIPSLQKKLESLLPYSIPLWERINFHLAHRPIPKTSKIFVATCIPEDNTTAAGDPPGSVIDGWLRQDTATSTSPSSPWLAAHVDLTHYGQTQVWLFSSWECPSRTTADVESDDDRDGHMNPSHQALVQSIFTYIYKSLVPTMPATTPPPEWTTLLRSGKTLTTPYSRNKIIFGTVSDRLWKYFPRHSRTRTDPDYVKYVFGEQDRTVITGTDSRLQRQPQRQDDTKISSLPENYKFTTLTSKHLQTVLDRSTIPRTLSTLSEFINVGVLYTADDDDDRSNRPDQNSTTPIAWGFLGKDSSISSLHTEPQHRGKGLALCVARELLMRRRRQQHNQQQTDNITHQHRQKGPSPTPYYWAHADVSKSNMPSRRVMEKLGGKPMWMVMWTELDLEKIFQPSTS